MRHWSEGEHVVAYHGTHEDNVDNILHNGVSHKDPNTGKVSVAIGSNGEEVASAYACMSGAGGEHKFRQPGANVVSVPPHKRVVVVMHIPRAWADQHVDQSHGGNSDHIKAILRNPALFHKNVATTGTDWKRTEPVELRFGEAIPAKYIVGTKVKGQQMKPVEKAIEERMMTFKEFSVEMTAANAVTAQEPSAVAKFDQPLGGIIKRHLSGIRIRHLERRKKQLASSDPGQ